MKVSALWPLLWVACGDGRSDKVIDGPSWDDTDASPPSPCAGDAEVDLTFPTPPLAADVPLTVVLTHPDAEAADLTVQYSLDGDVWRAATLASPAAGLASSAEGVEHVVTWDTVADLGYEAATVALQVIARSASCDPWPLAEVEDLGVDNTATPVPVCGVTLQADEAPLEGDAVLRLVVAHEEATEASLELQWTENGTTWTPARLRSVDCDGDAAADQGVGVPLSPEGVAACLTWDSQADLAVDTTVTLRAACLVQGLEQASATLEGLLVRNDPSPDPGELAITELMPVPAAPDGHYIELQNTSGHILDVEGLWVGRWRQVTPLTSPPDREFTVTSETGVLTVPPGAQVLLGKSSDDAASGCRPVDEVWPTTFSLSFDSTLVLRHHDVEIASLAFFQSTGWSFTEGTALGVDPTVLGSPSALDRNGWCLQRSAVPGCAAVPTTGELGTPGALNDPCR